MNDFPIKDALLMAYEVYEREEPTEGVCDYCGKKKMITHCSRPLEYESYSYICVDCVASMKRQDKMIRDTLDQMSDAAPEYEPMTIVDRNIDGSMG
jgi:hypothetical protein